VKLLTMRNCAGLKQEFLVLPAFDGDNFESILLAVGRAAHVQDRAMRPVPRCADLEIADAAYRVGHGEGPKGSGVRSQTAKTQPILPSAREAG